MKLLTKIKLLLGLEKPPAPPHIPTLLEQLQAQLQPLENAQKQELLKSKQTEIEQQLQSFISARGSVEPGPDPVIWQQFEVAAFIYKQLRPVAPDEVDPAYEHLLGTLVSIFQLNAKPASEVFSVLDSYVQQFEEPLLFHEAGGVYSFGVSENKKVIRFPFMQPKAVKTARMEEATKVLGQVFVESRELALLELDTHAPWVPISFLEITELARTGSIACVQLPGAHQYYGFLS